MRIRQLRSQPIGAGRRARRAVLHRSGFSFRARNMERLSVASRGQGRRRASFVRMTISDDPAHDNAAIHFARQ